MRTRAISKLAAIVLVTIAACRGDDDSGSASAVNAPSELKVVALEGGAHLTWKDNSDNEAEFMIERMIGAADWMAIGSVPFNTTQYHDPNLTPGTVYMYRVMAMPKAGDKGSYSNEVTFTAPAAGASGTGGADASGAAGAHGGH